MRRARLLTSALLAVMVAQAVLGLLFQGSYRDQAWITATWFGNDWVTLVLAAPLLFFALVHAGRGSVRANLVWLGVIAYAIYNQVNFLSGERWRCSRRRRCWPCWSMSARSATFRDAGVIN